MPHSHGLLHHLAHNFDWAFEVEALTRAHVQLQCDGIQFFLAVYRQVCAFGQVLADQAVDVFVAAALPGAVRVAEVNRHPSRRIDLSMPYISLDPGSRSRPWLYADACRVERQ